MAGLRSRSVLEAPECTSNAAGLARRRLRCAGPAILAAKRALRRGEATLAAVIANPTFAVFAGWTQLAACAVLVKTPWGTIHASHQRRLRARILARGTVAAILRSRSVLEAPECTLDAAGLARQGLLLASIARLARRSLADRSKAANITILALCLSTRVAVATNGAQLALGRIRCRVVPAGWAVVARKKSRRRT